MSLRIISYRSLISLEREILDLYGKTPGLNFVVPASEDREWLKDVLLAHGTFGSEPFRIYRWDELYRELCSGMEDQQGVEGLVQIDPPDHWLALHGLTSDLIAQWGEDLPPGVSQMGFVSSLGETVRELIREEIPAEGLMEGLFPDGQGHPDEPSWILGRIYGEYLSLLRERKLMDSAAISTEIAKQVDLGGGAWASLLMRPMVMVGFYSFNHSQLGMVRSMVRSGLNLTVLSPMSGMSDEYGALAQLEGASLKRAESSPFRMFSITGAGARHELETVARELVLWDKGLSSLPGKFPGWQDVAMMVPPNSILLAEEVLDRYGIPFNLMKGRTVSQTILWDTIRRAWDCHRDGWQPDPTSELLCLPWMVPEGDRRGLARSSARGLKEWRNYLKDQQELLRALDAVANFCKTLSSGDSCEGILRAVRDLASEVMDWRGTLSSQVEDIPDLDRSVLELGSAVGELDRKLLKMKELQVDLGEIGSRHLKGGEAMAFLSVWSDSSTVWPGPANLGSMSLYSGTPPVMAHHGVWIMTEATAKNWPGSLAESPLLREAQKEELHSMDIMGSRLDRTHLPLLAEKRLQKEVLFRRLMACGDGLLIVSRPSVDGSGRPLMESPFIKRAVQDSWVDDLGSLDRPSGRILPSWTEPVVLPSEVHQTPSGMFTFRPDRTFPQKPTPVALRTIALSSVDGFRVCPFRFRCSYIEGLYPPDPGGFSPALAGTAMHEIMNRAWGEYLKDDSKPLTGLVDEIWESVLEETYRSMVIDRDLARRKAMFYSELMSGVSLVQSIESGGLRDRRVSSLTELDLPRLPMDSVAFTGKADRLDILDDGRAIIWDYKSGNSSSYSSSLQLAAYGVLLSQGYPGVSCVGGYGFIGFRSGSVTGTSDDDTWGLMGLKAKSRIPLESRFEEAKALLDSIDRAVGSGEFPPDYDSSGCARCGYSSLCRRGELRGKEDDDDQAELS